MIRFIRADELKLFPKLRDSMFRDRAVQFRHRLRWDVQVDREGLERDTYDTHNPLYVIYEGSDGLHQGSMRFLPMTGPNMIRDHFSELLDPGVFEGLNIWECTRFCLGENAAPQIAGRLMAAGGAMLNGLALDGFVGVFDARMTRIYARIGANPEVLGRQGEGKNAIGLGLWRFSKEARFRVAQRAGVSQQVVSYWFECCFGELASNPFDPALE